MKKTQSGYRAFVALCLILGIFLCMRAWKLRALAEGTVRNAARNSLEILERERGWLLSDIDIQSVTKEEIVLFYQPHKKGEDTGMCFVMTLSSHSLAPCDAKP